MPVEMTCPNGHKFQVSEAHVGQEVRCPTCKVSFVAAASGGPTGTGQPLPAGAGLSALGERLGLGAGRSLFSLEIGRPVLMVGLLLVLLARGCDTVGNRSVQRTKGKVDLAENSFDDEYDTKRLALEQKVREIDGDIEEIQDKDERTEADDAKIEDLRKKRTDTQKQISDLRDEQKKKRESLERTTWRALEIAARDAQTKDRMGAYWREMLFVFGTIVLSFGLLIVSWTAQGAERWICLIMLAIITFSLYVGGIAWVAGLPIR